MKNCRRCHQDIDMTTQILGVPASLPLYFTATALAKLAHQERKHVESMAETTWKDEAWTTKIED